MPGNLEVNWCYQAISLKFQLPSIRFISEAFVSNRKMSEMGIYVRRAKPA
jgi:hypothetical protein